jgi:L-aminopeptidase/D-esterase-like protein
LGADRAVKGGIGTASQQFGDGIIVGAIVAVNAFGDVVGHETGRIIAGPRRLDGNGFLDTAEILKSGQGVRAFAPTSTTIGVIATNARLSKTQATKVAQMAHDGLARVIRPVHTMYDGDVIFVLSVGKDSRKQADVTTVGTVAAEVIAKAVIRGITQADGLCGIPSVNEVW